jgi:hypothetical protein
MGWGNYAGAQGGGQNKGWVEEGNASIFMFSDEPTRCRFLTEDVKVEDVMAELKVTREEAEDALYTKVLQDRWVMPKPVWEHTIKEIPGKRFFSTTACLGRNRCPMCKENDAAKESGVTENKFLPYPLRKRFLAPAYFYDLNRVLFVRAAEDFFDGVADYINKHGSDCDFDIYKTGKGLDTKYKSVFSGVCKVVPDGGYPPVGISPRDLDTTCSEEELGRRINGGARREVQTAPVTTPSPAPAQAARTLAQAARALAQAAQAPTPTQASAPAAKAKDEFILPFGQHKGLTFSQLVSAGNGEYVKFLADNSAGAVQKAAKEFLGLA